MPFKSRQWPEHSSILNVQCLRYPHIIHGLHINSSPAPVNAHFGQVVLSLLLPYYEFASISSHTFLMCSLFSFAASRFSLVRSRRCARRHRVTLCLASLQFPKVFQRKPWAWHSSRMAITSAQSIRGLADWLQRSNEGEGTLLIVWGM